MADLLYRYDRSVTVHNRCSKIPPSTWMHIANRVRKSRVRLEVMIRFFMRIAASEKRASSSSRVSTFHLFTPLFIQPHIQKSNGRNMVHIRATEKYLNVCDNTNKYTWIKYVWSCYLPTCLYRFVGRDSSVDIATGYGLDGPGIESRWGRDFLHTSRPALGPTQPPVKWVPSLSRG
jgi:hypothetical protein